MAQRVMRLFIESEARCILAICIVFLLRSAQGDASRLLRPLDFLLPKSIRFWPSLVELKVRRFMLLLAKFHLDCRCGS